MATSADIRSGASTAATYPTPATPMTVTRADIVGPARRNSLVNVETTGFSSATLKFPQDIGPHFFNIGISRNNRTSLNSFLGLVKNDITNTESTIVLPLPESIKDITQISYTESSVVGVSQLGQAAGAGISDVTNQFSTGKGPIANFINSIGSTIGAVAGQLVDPVKNEAMARSGLTPNQMLTVMLQGPTYKEHSFSWKLYPRNAKESLTIRSIISKLKDSARPGTDVNRQFFEFPRLFNLSFHINGKTFTGENDAGNYFFAFKPAVLMGISVNYTPSGQPSLYKGIGAPDGVEITLNFKEVEYWLNEGSNTWQGSLWDYSKEFGGAAASAGVNTTLVGGTFSAGFAAGVAPDSLTGGGRQ